MMLIIYHNGSKVIEVINFNTNAIIDSGNQTIAKCLFELAKKHPNSILVWCNVQLKNYLNTTDIEALFHHHKFLFSFNPTAHYFFDNNIGYVDASPFLKVNKKVVFPTWQMSSWAGAVHAEVILAIQNEIPMDDDFDYFLSSLAKIAMPKGLFCYSEPRLLSHFTVSNVSKSNMFTLFRFVKQHYKTQWVFLLFFNLFLYQRKFPIMALVFSLFFKNRRKLKLSLDQIPVHSTKKVVRNRTVDVIIPTIGRKDYLYNVLKDFSKQTLLPHQIIIVEQNPIVGSNSDLNYIQEEKWPFIIHHIFTHQAGACNARNLALEKTTSEWVFLADDDNRFESNLLLEVFENIEKYGVEVVTTAYPQENELKKYRKIIQWPAFGAGNSFVKSTFLNNVRFNMALEFGYGEDGDFGMQLRNQGCDVIFFPEPSILHLKAPIGGFRSKPDLQWKNDKVQPKPSPTVMLYQNLHNTQEQIQGYKIILFLKYYKLQNIKNPVRYFYNFKKQWNSSVFWANELKSQNEV